MVLITRDNERMRVDVLPPAHAWRGDVQLEGSTRLRCAMSTLRQLPSGEWAIKAPGREPVRIAAGEFFSIKVRRAMRRTRMDQCDGGWLAVLSGVRGAGRRVELRDGLGASFFDRREWYAKLVD